MKLRIIMDSSLVEWKELGEEGSTDNENEWEDERSIPNLHLGIDRESLILQNIMVYVEIE